MNIEPLPRSLHDRLIKEGCEAFSLQFSGGHDEGDLSVDISWNKPTNFYLDGIAVASDYFEESGETEIVEQLSRRPWDMTSKLDEHLARLQETKFTEATSYLNRKVLERDVEDWATDAYEYSGAGDGTRYGDNITYDLLEKTADHDSWYMVSTEGSSSSENLTIKESK